MHRARAIRSLLCAGISFALISGCTAPRATPPIQTPAAPSWSEIRGSRFLLRTDLGLDSARSFAREVEFFLALAQRVMGLTSLPERHAEITVFSNESDFARYRTHPSQAGLFYFDEDHAVALMTHAQSSRETHERLFHELTHFLMFARQANAAYPLWYSEGLAELLSSAQRKQGRALIGIPPLRIIAARRSPRWIPLERLVRLASTDRMNAEEGNFFYAESWAFVHYLHVSGHTRGIRRLPQLIAYLAELRAGADPVEAAPRAFGVPLTELDAELREHWLGSGWRSGVLGVALADLVVPEPPAPRALASAERDEMLIALTHTLATRPASFDEPIDLPIEIGPIENPFAVDPPIPSVDGGGD